MIDPSRRPLAWHGCSFQVLPEWGAALKAFGIGPDGGWMGLSRGRLVSRSPSTRCFRIELPGQGSLYFKRYVYAPRKLLEFWLRPSKAVVEAWGFARLRSLGIPTLEVLGLGEVRTFGMLRGAVIVTRGVESTLTLAEFARDVWYPLPKPERRRVYREISDQLVEQLRRAHQGDFFHHDLKWRNILIQRQDDAYTPVWIDCPRAYSSRLGRGRGIVGDLSALARLALSYCSLQDRYRFLRRYLGPEASAGEVKALFRRVQAHLERRPPRPLELPPRP